MSELLCAISISTHDRLPELEETLRVVARLDPQPHELLICADGCSDGTVSFLRENFPSARLIVHEKPRGSIVSRDELIRSAESDIVVSLDDDSHPLEADFIARISRLFSEMPHVAVASFPQRSDEFPETLTQADFGPSRFVANYVNAAAAFRRPAYLALEGWPREFEHSYDEPDYSLQCLAAGHAVFHFTGVTIRHRFTQTKRNEIHNHHRHSRNEQWSLWKRCPFPFAFGISAFRAARQLGYARKRGWLTREPHWWWKCLAGMPRVLRSRRPVPWRIYRNWMQLTRRPIESAEQWQQLFGGRK